MALQAGEGESLELHEVTKSLDFELAYTKSAAQSDATVHHESVRRARVGLILLEEENLDLHEQLVQENSRTTDLEGELDTMREQQTMAVDMVKNLEDALRRKSRETTGLQDELADLRLEQTRSSKLVAEKLALAQELANLMPELEHLRKQASDHQTTLSEKFALQRELNSVEVDLENEKRTTQRLLTKQNENEALKIELKEQTDQLRKGLAKEKREREGVEREVQASLTAEEGVRAALEERLVSNKQKMRAMKARLKESEIEMQQLRASETAALKAASEAASEAASARAAAADEVARLKKKPRKRKEPTAELETIGTPGEHAVTGRGSKAKRDKRVSALPGDKSTFSITPFLNRTASLAPEDPGGVCAVEPVQEEEGANLLSENHPAPESTTDVPPAKRKRNVKKLTSTVPSANGENGEASSKKGRKAPAKVSRPKKGATAQPVLQVVEEQEEERGMELSGPPTSQQATASVETVSQSPTVTAATAAAGPPERRGKKRKLLASGAGRTLFDEEEVDSVKPLSKSIFGGTNKLPVLARKKGNGLAATAAFSPLKRDKRGPSMIQ